MTASSVGIVGGGQLARMTALDAARLGIDVRVLAGHGDEGVRDLLPVIEGQPDDIEALRRLAKGVDVVTFDHELVPLDVVRQLEDDGAVVRPGSTTLAYTDKLYQRRAFAEADIPVPAHAEVTSATDIEEFAAAHGWPVVLKAPRGGYDGRGVAVADTVEDAEDMLSAASGQPLLAEEHLDLVAELAVVHLSSADGDQTSYAPVRSIQIDGMCREIHAGTDQVPVDLAAVAVRLAGRVAQLVEAIGVLAVELFVVGEGADRRVLVNEIAARPHNSGHHTIDSCITSQFENHARAVLGLPLGSVTQREPAAVMVNVVGTEGDPRSRLGAVPPEAKIHLYDKTPRPGRKIGHVTVVGQDHDEVADTARRAAAILEGRT